MKMWLIALLLVSVTHTHAEYSSLQAILSQKGLQKVTHWLTDWVQDNLSNITPPDIKGKAFLFGYTLHSMSIQRCDLPEPIISFLEGTGVSLQVTGLSAVITGKWNSRFGFTTDSGEFELVMFNVGFKSLLKLGSDRERLSISTVICSSDVESVQMNFSGGKSFLYKLFVKLFNRGVKQMVQGQICTDIKAGVNGLESHLAAMPVAMMVDPNVYMNISLTDSPLVKNSGLGLNVKGEFYSFKCPTEPPFHPSHFEMPWQKDYMVSVGASEFCVNSAAFAYHHAGVLNIHITDDMIPKACPIHLNTSQFKNLIPELPKKYPDMLMELQLYTTDTPLFSVKKSVILANVSTSVKAFAIKTNYVAIPLFRLDMETSFIFKVYIDKQLVKGMLVMKNLTVTLGASEIGKFQTEPIQHALKSVMTSFVLPKVNAQLKDGIQLPFVKYFSLKNSVLTIEDGFLALATDINGPDSGNL
ncbi:bactericidal permeability-increasing protein-like isoform X2 [Hoplias malabaricus]